MPNESPLPLRYLAGGVLTIVVLPVSIWLVWGWIEAARLDRALDALEARHERLDLAAFETTPTTAEQREASHLYARATKLVAGLPIASQDSAALGAAIEQLCDSDTGSREVSERTLQAFEERYRSNYDLLDRASALDAAGWSAADRPQAASIETTYPITLARANAVRVARLACTGKADEAARALLSTLRLRHVWVANPFPIPATHGLHAVLTGGIVSPELLKRLQQEFTALDDEHVFEKWMRRHRAFWLAYTMPGAFSDLPSGTDSRQMTPVEGMLTKIVRPLRDHQTVAELREYDEALEVGARPWPQKIDAARSFTNGYRGRRSSSGRQGLLESVTRPFGAHVASAAMTGYLDGITESLARTRASIGVIAATRYKRDHFEQLPDTLQQLVPTYLPAPLIDPYTGGELRYWRHCHSGYKVYSVGIDRKDDGGKWEQHSDLQQSRRGNPLDVGVEVGVWPQVCK